MRAAAAVLPLVALITGCNSVNMARAKVVAVDGVPVAAHERRLEPPKLVHSGTGDPALFIGRKAHALVEATVTADGVVTDVRVVDTDDATFGEAFARSIGTSRFEPARKDGAPVAVRMAFFEDRKPGGAIVSSSRLDTVPNTHDLFGPPIQPIGIGSPLQ